MPSVDELVALLGRVITVSSGGMYGQALPAGDPKPERDEYRPEKLYARTKRQQVVLNEMWAERRRGTVFHAMHPGWVDTPGIRDALPGFSRLIRRAMRDAAQGADTIVWLGAAPEALASSGRFWHDRRERPTHYPCSGRARIRRRRVRSCGANASGSRARRVDSARRGGR